MCAGPPAAALHVSRHMTQQQRLGSAALTDQDHKCIQVGSVISPCYIVLICSFVVWCCCRYKQTCSRTDIRQLSLQVQLFTQMSQLHICSSAFP